MGNEEKSQATAELPKLPEPLIRREDFPAFQAKIAMNCYSAVQMDHRWREGYEAGRASRAQSEWISEVTEKAQALVNFLDTPFSLVSLGKGEVMLNDLRDVLGAGATLGETK